MTRVGHHGFGFMTSICIAININNNLTKLILSVFTKRKKRYLRMKFITWNIDGLDPNQTSETISRTNRAIKVLKEYDIIFLQEVTEKTHCLIKSQMQQYFVYGGVCPDTWRGYHVAILVKKSIVKNGYLNFGEKPDKKKSAGDKNPRWKAPDQCCIIRFNPITRYRPFINSAMGRGILYTIFTSIDKKRYFLATSHLESLQQNSWKRVQQFKNILDIVQKEPVGTHIIFGGDFNLRDVEFGQISGVHGNFMRDNMNDVWIAAGKPADKKFTWDLSR